MLALASLAFMSVTPALAEPVTYSTTGGFSASGGASSATFGGAGNTLTLSFAGVASTTVTADPTTNGSAGTITASITGTGGTATGTFTLTIDQTDPSVGSGGLSGALSGTITSNSSSGTLSFTSTALTLGDITYTLQQPPGGYDLVPPNTNGGMTSIQLQINATAVPEPAFFGLTGLGFFGLAGIAYRRYRQAHA
jgi:hypothetical protein